MAAATQGSYRLLLTEVTGMLVVTQRRSRVFGGSPEELDAAYRRVRRHNLLLGWWGFPFGVPWTTVNLWRNRRRHAALRRLTVRSR
jgi:hypothetical protein